MNETHPLISIIIPTRSINHYITHENLPAIDQQTYRTFEVILLPNENDTEGDELIEKYPWLRIIATKKVTRPAEKRDIGARHAKGEILAFIDDDAYARADWLENAVKVFNTDVKDNIRPAVVCGPGMLPVKSKFWEQVFDAVLCSWIGSGGYAYRFTPKPARIVDDYPSMNFLIKKNVFDAVGGFHSEFWPGEDSKLCEDVVYKEHGVIYYDPTVLVYHHRRNSLKHYLKQHGNYGYHRGAFFAHGDKNSRRIEYIIPSLFVLYLIAVTAFSVYQAVIVTSIHAYTIAILGAFIPLKLYKLAIGTVLIQNAVKGKNYKIVIMAPIVLFLMHLAYGVMFIKGLIIGTIKKEAIY